MNLHIAFTAGVENLEFESQRTLEERYEKINGRVTQLMDSQICNILKVFLTRES